ncbi:hypothetical protein SAMN05518849_14610 [Sphingobium sp. AP50]|uniref:M1 family metallopeptidase n=1 Tax=Sphingobium sp. AP50 TaxID=1884369 RepID=UPI0008AD838F|nr:M1 family metallopeptidase [Sphingobium sp. AP50]SEK06764.1 hypothetical protein SAMN05518849_14610 [Sphingobium sp. AP50]
MDGRSCRPLACYLAQEFYLEYGDLDYWLMVPANLLSAGSGELVNRSEVLTVKDRAQLVDDDRRL